MKKMIGMCLASLLTLLSFGQEGMTEDKLKSLMSSMMGDVEYEESYSFSKSIVYVTSELSSSGTKKSTGKMEMLFSENGENFGMKLLEENGKPIKDEITILMDIKGKAMITLIEDKSGDKSGIAMKLPKEGMNVMGLGAEEDEGSIIKTSETKVIKGYTCTKYVGKSGNIKSEFWVANDLKMNFTSAFQQLFKAKKNSFGQMPDGTLMEAVSTDENGKKTIMEVVEVNANKTTKLIPQDYNVKTMGQMMQGIE